MGSTEPQLNQGRKLFSPLRIGNISLSHRIVMSALTRTRSPGGIPTDIVAKYYSQRATEGGLLISEGSLISFMAGNLHNIPGIYKPEQVEAWKKVTAAVHEKGGFIFCQLWHTGRFTVSTNLNDAQPISASATNAGVTNLFTPKGRVPSETAKEMSLQEIKDTITEYTHAAKCAIEAGFDGVEILGGNSYLPDQFLNPHTNLRTDNYGGTIPNRCRFTLEIVSAVTTAIGPERTAIRFSPFGTFVMKLDTDPLSTFTYLLTSVEKMGLAYICLVQPRSDMFLNIQDKNSLLTTAAADGRLKIWEEDISLKYFRGLLEKTPMFANGGYDGENCFKEVEKDEISGVVFGKWFISNPDLVERVREGRELAGWRPERFYAEGEEGYSDYPVWGESV